MKEFWGKGKWGGRKFGRTFAPQPFILGGVKPKPSSSDSSSETAQESLQQARVMSVTEPEARRRFQQLLRKHHYLGGLKAVGEQMYYAAADA